MSDDYTPDLKERLSASEADCKSQQDSSLRFLKILADYVPAGEGG